MTLDRPTKLGIDHLRTALTKMLNAHIRQSIPKLIPEIKEKIANCTSELKLLGHACGTRSEQLDCMIALATKFSSSSENALNGQYQTLPDTQNAKVRKLFQDALDKLQLDMRRDCAEYFNFDEDGNNLLCSEQESEWEDNILEHRIFQKIYDAIRVNRGKEFAEEVNNPCVLSLLWNDKTESWTEKVTALIDNFAKSISMATTIFLKTICLDEDLQKNTQRWLLGHLPLVVELAKKELYTIISDEANGIWTMNPRRRECAMKLQTKRITKMAQELARLTPYRQDNVTLAEIRVKSWLEKNGSIVAVFKTHDTLASYYEVAMNRFIDNVGLQVIERHLLGPSSPLKIFTALYVTQESEKDESLLERLARERASKRQQREEWTKKQQNLEEMLQTTESMGYFGPLVVLPLDDARAVRRLLGWR